MLILGLIAGFSGSDLIIDQAYAQQPQNNLFEQVQNNTSWINYLEIQTNSLWESMGYREQSINNIQLDLLSLWDEVSSLWSTVNTNTNNINDFDT